MEGLDQGGMGPENVLTLHGQAVWDSKLLNPLSVSLAMCDSERLTGHGTDTSEFPTVVH
jgi:hypothetical protein